MPKMNPGGYAPRGVKQSKGRRSMNPKRHTTGTVMSRRTSGRRRRGV